jgi:hypothetical protein
MHYAVFRTTEATDEVYILLLNLCRGVDLADVHVSVRADLNSADVYAARDIRSGFEIVSN